MLWAHPCPRLSCATAPAAVPLKLLASPRRLTEQRIGLRLLLTWLLWELAGWPLRWPGLRQLAPGDRVLLSVPRCSGLVPGHWLGEDRQTVRFPLDKSNAEGKGQRRVGGGEGTHRTGALVLNSTSGSFPATNQFTSSYFFWVYLYNKRGKEFF